MIERSMLLQERYRVISHLARGGMGSVYLAEDLRLHTTVALKQMLVDSERLSEAFNREAQLLAALRHPTIPRVIDHFTDRGGQFLVMEYIAGDDLGSVLARRNQPLGLSDVLRWADELLSALHYLHTHDPPVIHRDIKPQNLKLTAANTIALLDFGLAKTGPAGVGAGSESIFGYTPHYAPIEQIQGQGTDARTDLYALGATLYHLLTGVMPVDAVSRASAVVNALPDPLKPPDELNPAVPGPVAAVLLQALAQRAADRPQSAAEMRENLRIALHDAPALDLPARRRPTRPDDNAAQLPTRARSTIRLPAPIARQPPLLRFALLGGLAAALAGAGSFGWAATRGATASVPPTPGPVATAAPVEPMNGSLNIAVANFVPAAGETCAVKPDEAAGLAGVVYATLAAELEAAKAGPGDGAVALGDFQLRSPAETGALAVDGDPEQAAAQKARELNADVVLYGEVGCATNPRQTRLVPQLYLSDRKLQSFDQLLFIGAHPFGDALTEAGLPASGPTRQLIAEGLTARMRVLTQFLVGLDYFYAGTHDQAAAAFGAASEVVGFDDPFISAMVLLFRGTADARRQAYAEAKASYARALELDPANQTARYSLADATHWAARGDCTADAQRPDGKPEDAEGLREALRLLGQIDAPGDSVQATTVRGMAAYIAGQVYACMTQAGIADDAGVVNNWASAERQYGEAIRLLGQERAYTSDYLAEAHAGLALVYLTDVNTRDRATVEARWRRAGEEYCAASGLSGYAQRRAAFLHRLAAIHGYLGEYEQAALERERAAALDPAGVEQYDTGLHRQWLAEQAGGAVAQTPLWTCEPGPSR